MTTTLGTGGEIGIPSEFREADHLDAGDRFQIERVLPGHYVLSRIGQRPVSFSVENEADGLPVVRTQEGIITAALVREIEGLAQ